MDGLLVDDGLALAWLFKMILSYQLTFLSFSRNVSKSLSEFFLHTCDSGRRKKGESEIVRRCLLLPVPPNVHASSTLF
jgi:hypothetical protein